MIIHLNKSGFPLYNFMCGAINRPVVLIRDSLVNKHVQRESS